MIRPLYETDKLLNFNKGIVRKESYGYRLEIYSLDDHGNNKISECWGGWTNLKDVLAHLKNRGFNDQQIVVEAQ